MRRPRSFRVCIPWLLAGVLLAGCAHEPPTSTETARNVPALPTPLALSCLTCHGGPDADRHAVDLDTLSASRIAAELYAFRDGTREGTVMPRLAKALSDDDIAQLSRAFEDSAP